MMNGPVPGEHLERNQGQLFIFATYISVEINKHSPRIELLVLVKFVSRVSHRI